jgi:hypothetical protein
VEKILDPTGTQNSESLVFQPIASRYTDYGYPDQSLEKYNEKESRPSFDPMSQWMHQLNLIASVSA